MEKAGTQRLVISRRKVGRRRLALVAVLIAAGIVVLLGLPYAQRAIRHFQLPLYYSSVIRQQASEKHVDPALIAAVIYAETRFSPRTSSTGAEGLMQIEPATAEFLAKRSGGTEFKVSDLSAPQVNIAYGTYYLRYLLNEFDGNRVLALAAYNGGDTNVQKWVQKYQQRGQRFVIKDIPIAQTQAYVREVLSKEQEYRQHYAKALGYS